MKNCISILFILAAHFFLVSCATTKPAEEAKAIVVQKNELSLWTAKAQIKELKTEKVQQVSLDFVALEPTQIRVDVSGPLGISLATLVVQNNQIQYALYRQKSFYEGVANEKALRSVFRMDLDARHLLNICFDKPIREKGWKCQADAKGLIESCTQEERGLSIKWTERDGYKKRVILANAEYEVQILYKDYSTKVLSPEAADAKSSITGPFHLEIPEGFQKYKIL